MYRQNARDFVASWSLEFIPTARLRRFILTLRLFQKMRIAPIIIGLLMLCLTSVKAQKGYEVGGWLGVGHYFGDLNTTYSLNRLGLAGGLIGRYNFNERVCLRIGGSYGRVSAYDSDSDNSFNQARNLSFRSDIIEGIGVFEFNFLPYVHGSQDEFFTPYLFGGLGLSYFTSKAQLDGRWVPLQPLGTEGQSIGGEYNKGAISWVYGFGLKLDLNYVWSLNFEISGRTLFSDYLDDVSTTYPNQVELQALRGDDAARLSDRSGEIRPEPIGEEGRQRGTSSTNDSYAFLSIGLVYYIGSLQCPPISRPR